MQPTTINLSFKYPKIRIVIEGQCYSKEAQRIFQRIIDALEEPEIKMPPEIGKKD